MYANMRLCFLLAVLYQMHTVLATDEEDDFTALHGVMTLNGANYFGVVQDPECNSVRHLKQLSVPGPKHGWFSVALESGFAPGSKIVLKGRAEDGFNRLQMNLGYQDNIVLHLDNRWNFGGIQNTLVMNTFVKKWFQEIKISPAPIERGELFTFSIECEETYFKICVNGEPYAIYAHRVPPSMINEFGLYGISQIFSLHYGNTKNY